MFSIAYIITQDLMRRRMIGARVSDPVLPSTEQRRRKPVDRRRPAQRRPHVALVAPQTARSDEHLC
jgi:hypothetical protein